MRRLTALALLALAFAPQPATAAERGSIVGRVLNATTGEPQARAGVTLIVVDRNAGRRTTRKITTGPGGRYRFEDLETGEDWIYVIDARYDGGLFPGSPVRIPGTTDQRPVLDTTLRVWDTTDDPAAVVVERHDIFVVPGERGSAVVEAVNIANPTQLAYVGRRDDGSTDSSSFGFALPADAGPVRIEDATLDIPKLVPTDFGFAITTAIPPGKTRVTFSYTVDGTAGVTDLTRTSLYPTADMNIHAEEPLDIAGNRLQPGNDLELRGTTYRTWALDGRLDAGDPMQIVATADAGMSWPLVAGAAGAAAIAALLFVLGTRRRRRPVAAPKLEPSAERSEVVSAIATLDLEFERGEIERDDWQRRRDELKARLRGPEVPVP